MRKHVAMDAISGCSCRVGLADASHAGLDGDRRSDPDRGCSVGHVLKSERNRGSIIRDYSGLLTCNRPSASYISWSTLLAWLRRCTSSLKVKTRVTTSS